jgi:hypothetical protein
MFCFSITPTAASPRSESPAVLSKRVPSTGSTDSSKKKKKKKNSRSSNSSSQNDTENFRNMPRLYLAEENRIHISTDDLPPLLIPQVPVPYRS